MTDKEKDEIVKPKNYEIMIEKARELSKGHAFLRVDLYNIDGKIYFGELTFYTTAGFMKLEPVEYDKILGDMINLKEKNKNNKKEG